jgi:Outer membrane protein beta-barrel domain
MKRMSWFGAPLVVFTLAGTAAAQGTAGEVRNLRTSPIVSPHDAFEVGLTAGYTQPQGNLTSGTALTDQIGPGFVAGLDLGYRLSPHWALGVGGQYHESTIESALPSGSSARGIAAQIRLAYHVWPTQFADPYLAIGTGYRALWELPPGTNDDVLLHGFDLARVELGLEYRVTQDFSIGPFLAVDLNLFGWRDPESGPSAPLTDKRVNAFFSGSFAARFDLGGSRVTSQRAIAAATAAR